MPSVHDHGLTTGEVFRLTWTGYFWGVGSLFLPFTVLAMGMVALRRPNELFDGLVALFMFPLVVAGQALLIGAAVAFGLSVHRHFSRLSHAERPPTA